MTVECKADAPHVPAAFINVLHEEGTRDELIYHLQITWNELCQAKRELSLAQSRLAEVEKDAERYRWLRSQDWDTSPLFVVKQPTEVSLGTDCPSRERLDAAIDEAIIRSSR